MSDIALHKVRIKEGYQLLEKAYKLLEPYLPYWAESELENVMDCADSLLEEFNTIDGKVIKHKEG